MPEVASGAPISVSAGGDNGDAAVGDPYQRGPDPTLAGVPPDHGFNGGATHHPGRHQPGPTRPTPAGGPTQIGTPGNARSYSSRYSK